MQVQSTRTDRGPLGAEPDALHSRTPSQRRHDLEVVAVPFGLLLVTLALCIFTAAPALVR